MKEYLIEGGYDLHVHSAPDVLPRKMDDIEMAQRITEAKMGGYAIKSHYFCTSERAELINSIYPDCDAVGTITLNSSVGGMNPTAVEMAGRSGAKLVWFPTCDSEHERALVFQGDPNKKLPYWAQIIVQMKEEGIESPLITIFDEKQEIRQEVLDILDIIAKYKMILATGHLSHDETFALVKEAHKRNVENIVITHVDFPTTFYTVEEQKELLKYGAYMEHCYTTFATGKVDFEETYRQICEIGADHVILATDLGQKTAKYPDEGLLEFACRLVEKGMSEEDVRKMVCDNPRKLLGK